MNKELFLVDLFSGCGGFNEGFKKAGFKTIVSNDIWEPAYKTFFKNNPSSPFVLGDITEINIKKKIINLGKNSTILIGGPPCQAYSMAGVRNVDDPRGKLFEDYLEIVNQIKPKFFVMENVKGLLSMEHDKETLTKNEKKELNKIKFLENQKNELLLKRKRSKNTEKVLFSNKDDENLLKIKEKLKSLKKNTSNLRVKVTNTIRKRFNQLGYNVEMKVLNSADYGVPQKRERVILIGSVEKYSIKFPNPIYREKNKVGLIDLFKDNHPEWITVKEAIDDLKNIPENTDINHIFTKCGTDFIEKIKKTPIGKSVYGGFSDAYFRCYPNEPSKTVKENHGGVFIHYEKDRFMTPRELARLQSFEDSFIFEGTKSQILVQIGNAVPPKLSFAIAETLLKEF